MCMNPSSTRYSDGYEGGATHPRSRISFEVFTGSMSTSRSKHCNNYHSLLIFEAVSVFYLEIFSSPVGRDVLPACPVDVGITLRSKPLPFSCPPTKKSHLLIPKTHPSASLLPIPIPWPHRPFLPASSRYLRRFSAYCWWGAPA